MPNPPSTASKLREYVAVGVAVGALVLFAVLCFRLLNNLGLEEPGWTRAVYVLTGIEAVAFAAAGFLFGSEVHRRRAESAEERAEENQGKADNAEKEAARVRAGAQALTTQIEAKLGTQPERLARGIELFDFHSDEKATQTLGMAQEQGRSDLEELLQVARKLFP
jgi:hypothetical protein